jgi:hypothetical protein
MRVIGSRFWSGIEVRDWLSRANIRERLILREIGAANLPLGSQPSILTVQLRRRPYSLPVAQ